MKKSIFIIALMLILPIMASFARGIKYESKSVSFSDKSDSYTAEVIRGDANGDGEIGMPDVVFVVNYILGSPADTINEEAADVNIDGEIGMQDVMFIVNYILNGKFPEKEAQIEFKQTMVLHHSNGMTSKIDLNTQPQIKFEGDKMQIVTTSLKKEYSKDDILSVTYQNNNNQNIEVTSTIGTIGETFYIYRNDGQFNAFFRDEVDSISYSPYDLDNLFHKGNVTQLVHTADSIYRIPLTSIDSIGFVQPETIFNSEVFPLTAEHSPYILNADTLHFTMSGSASDFLRPRIGNIVVSTADCDAFPDGIVARVIDVRKVTDGYDYSCEHSSLEGVFDQLVICSREKVRETSYTRSAVPLYASHTQELWNINWSSTVEGGGTTTTLNVGDKGTVTITACKTLTTPFFFQVEMQNELTSSIEFSAISTMGYFTQKQIGETLSIGRITVPYTGGLLWLVPKLSLYGYFQEEGKIELKYDGHLNRTDKISFTYTKGKWTFNHVPLTDIGTSITQLSMEGYAEVGLRPQVDFSLNGRRAGFGFSASVGLKEYINFVFDMTKLSDGGLYDAMRDSYCRTTIPWGLTAHASADMFKKYDSNSTDVGTATFSRTFEPRTEPRWGDDIYIFPLFSDVKGLRQSADTSKADVSISVSRTPLVPLQLGVSLLDYEGNIIQTKYDTRSYKSGNIFNNYDCEFTGLNKSEDYFVKPSIKLFGYDVLASPNTTIEKEQEEEKDDDDVHNGYLTCPDDHHPHMIDLGLPSGTLWACCNVGASAPEESGGYYAWGETKEKSEYTLEKYAHWKDLDGDGAKEIINIGLNIAGTQYDTATVNWGEQWQMPNIAQFSELFSVSSEWTTLNGVEGRMFRGINGGTIFLPSAGGRNQLLDGGGQYWTSNVIYLSLPPSTRLPEAYMLYFNHIIFDPRQYCHRFSGCSVRPVCKSNGDQGTP